MLSQDLLCSNSSPPSPHTTQPLLLLLLLLRKMSGRDKVTAQLEQYAASRAAADGVMTSSSGNPLDSLTTSLTAGPRGPILLQVRIGFKRERVCRLSREWWVGGSVEGRGKTGGGEEGGWGRDDQHGKIGKSKVDGDIIDQSKCCQDCVNVDKGRVSVLSIPCINA